MKSENPRIPLPKAWSTHVRWAILHVISLAQFATAHTRSWAANSVNARIRLKAERDRAVQDLALLREEARIKDARMALINPHRRPHTTLGGRTPNEVYYQRRAANGRPRIEPRTKWPRGSRCAKPQTLVAGKPGDAFTIRVDFQKGRRHLPVVTLNRAA